jgi:hypothetical protein
LVSSLPADIYRSEDNEEEEEVPGEEENVN